jgi:hypothetical protein
MKNLDLFGRRVLLVAICSCQLAVLAQADVFNDRFYQMGEDPFGIGADSQGVNLNLFPGAIDTGAFQDLVVAGAPTTVDIGPSGLARPGASSGALGAAFNGVDDSMSTIFSLNAPTLSWNNPAFYPDNIDGEFDPPSATGEDGPDFDTVYDPAFPHNYSTLFARGIQLWAYPDSSRQDVRQDLVVDTAQHGIHITENNTWGYQYGFSGTNIDSGVAVEFDEWTHVMSYATGGSNVLFINGVAQHATVNFYGADGSSLSIGSNQAGDGNFFQGVLDDVKLFVAGDNSEVLPGATNTELGYLGGGNWGRLVQGEDNDWIVQELNRLGALTTSGEIPQGDMNFDGVVDAADVPLFVDGWLSRNVVNNVQVGDWNSRANGDLNYDGITNLADLFIMNQALVNAGAGNITLAMLNGEASVPEPSSVVLVSIAIGGVLLLRRR